MCGFLLSDSFSIDLRRLVEPRTLAFDGGRVQTRDGSRASGRGNPADIIFANGHATHDPPGCVRGRSPFADEQLRPAVPVLFSP